MVPMPSYRHQTTLWKGVSHVRVRPSPIISYWTTVLPAAFALPLGHHPLRPDSRLRQRSRSRTSPQNPSTVRRQPHSSPDASAFLEKLKRLIAKAKAKTIMHTRRAVYMVVKTQDHPCELWLVESARPTACLGVHRSFASLERYVRGGRCSSKAQYLYICMCANSLLWRKSACS